MRLAGRNIAFVKKFTQKGGTLNGAPAIQIALLNDVDKFIYQSDRAVTGLTTAADVGAIFDALYAQGLSMVVEGEVAANPLAIAELDYDDTQLRANVIGDAGWFTFKASNQTSAIKEVSDHNWIVPEAGFPAFRDLALQRLSTLPSGVQASSYIDLAGSDDYINFTTGNTVAGYVDWSKDWTLGITLVGYPQSADQKYQCLFASGNNVIMIRRGGTNQSLYIASNNTGYASQGINTWAPINDGDRIMFEHNATSHSLRYFKGQAGAVPLLIGTLTVNATNIAANDPGDDFAIGRGNGLTNYQELLHWTGGLNNFIGQSSEMGTLNRISYFESVGQAFDEQTFYPDLASWAMLGEDSYPTVTDTKGALTGGELIGGTEEDFVPIDPPTES